MKSFAIQNPTLHQFPLVLSIPHSGTHVPAEIRAQMIPHVLLPNTDWFLPELYAFLPEQGVTTITAHLSRYAIDLNRSPAQARTGDFRSLVYETSTQGRPLYPQPLSDEEIKRRTESYYLPYHQALQQLLQDKLTVFPKVYLLDLHSFFLNFNEQDHGDILLSDWDHKTASPQTMHVLHHALESQGFSVTENSIKGGYLTRHFGTLFGERVESIQIELRYTAYLADRYFGEEEITEKDEALFASAQQKLKNAFSSILEQLSR